MNCTTMVSTATKYENPTQALRLCGNVAVFASIVDGITALLLCHWAYYGLLHADQISEALLKKESFFVELASNVQVLGLVDFLFFIVLINCLCLLTRNAVKEQKVLHVTPPMWLLLGWLVPGVNLVFPFLSVKKLAANIANESLMTTEIEGRLPWWWLCFSAAELSRYFLIGLGMVIQDKDQDAQGALVFCIVLMAFSVFSLGKKLLSRQLLAQLEALQVQNLHKAGVSFDKGSTDL